MRVHVEVTVDGGSLGLIVPWMELDREDPWIYLMPLAELVAAKHPEAEWTLRPLADDEDDRKALGLR